MQTVRLVISFWRRLIVSKYLEYGLSHIDCDSVFELIIIIHEGGHFVAARLMKIKVNEFSIGMGPKLIQFKRATQNTLFA